MSAPQLGAGSPWHPGDRISRPDFSRAVQDLERQSPVPSKRLSRLSQGLLEDLHKVTQCLQVHPCLCPLLALHSHTCFKHMGPGFQGHLDACPKHPRK